MRKTVPEQLPIVIPGVEHDHARELQGISNVLDANPEATKLVYDDLIRGLRNPKKGRKGMSAEQVLRALIIQKLNGFDYRDLEFHLKDSRTYHAFCRFGIGDEVPNFRRLQQDIKRVRPETLEEVNTILVQYAHKQGIEEGNKVRIDCTVEETNIHEPSDSWLLWDAVRVLTRLMKQARKLVDARFSNHERRAKCRYIGIKSASNEGRRHKLYRDLLKVSHKTLHYVDGVVEALEGYQGGVLDTATAEGLVLDLRHYAELAKKVIDQTERRVLGGEQVPASDKIVSLFEPHTDIIVKDRREVLYGHKLCLTSGASGMVLDCQVLDGNPADSTLTVEAIERLQPVLGHVPEQACFDGCFASKDNLEQLKELGVKDAAFQKKRGLEVEDMVREPSVYRALKRFRAGMEGVISFLKRCFGLARCTWRSETSFRAYTWASVVSANLLLIARQLN